MSGPPPGARRTWDVFGSLLCLALGMSVACAGRLAAAATVFHSPLNDGSEGPPVLVPATDSPVAVNIWVRPTPASPLASAPGERCAGPADPNDAGDDLCMWDIHVQGTGDLVLESFAAAADVVGYIDSTGADPLLRVNGGDPIDPNALPAPEPVGVLTVRAPPGGSGELQVTGNLWVTSLLTELPVDGTPGGQPLAVVIIDDADLDTIPDGSDNCPDFANLDQADVDSDGIGDDCTCGDATGDGVVDSQDVLANKNATLGLATPDTDIADCTGNGVVDANDVVCAKNRTLGLNTQCDMVCARMPTVRTGVPACP